ncbi:hypothetical protein Godav_024790, partial [Gossypium davidsonii]|nr:hypothetical protein [Gossypium davidsonii]
WINLCTAGVVQIILENTAARGVITIGNREKIMGYNSNFDKYSFFDTKLWDIFDGLALIHNRSYDGVLIQTDSLKVVKAIQNSFLSSSNSALIRRIDHLLLNGGLLDIQHLPRDRNKTIDVWPKWLLINSKD